MEETIERQEMSPDYETNGAVPCTGTEACVCDACIESRKDFTAWCDGFNERWAARKQARTAPSGLLTEVAS